jgi:uncharacterized coiled-coil DUF342 family protein
VNLQETFREKTRNIHGKFTEHSENIQEYSGNIQEAFREQNTPQQLLGHVLHR